VSGISATLAINEAVRARIASGEDILHLGFGEAGLPVPPPVGEVLRRQAHGRNSYPSVAGDPSARESVAGYFSRRNIPAHPQRVVLGPGSKSLLYALLAVLPGDVILPAPSWVSYAAQASLLGKRVIPTPIPSHVGGVPDPEALEHILDREAGTGGRPRVLLLTIPDNPTGTVADHALLERLCQIANARQLVIVADQIYADLAHDGRRPTSPAQILPERTIVTTGLSKSLALGGWRIGVALLPSSRIGDEIVDRLLQFASEVWSALPGPMQDVVRYAFAEPPELVRHIQNAQRLHREVARAVHTIVTDAGASCRPPQAGFYLYPDFSALGVASSSEELAWLLLDKHRVAVLAGSAFGDDPQRPTVRIATSLLYGSSDEQRWTALTSREPTRLPWIAAALDKLRTTMAALSETGSLSAGVSH